MARDPVYDPAQRGGQARTIAATAPVKPARPARAKKRSAETIPNNNRDRAPQQPIAASFGVAVLYRGF
jgi:hypothetical protein